MENNAILSETKTGRHDKKIVRHQYATGCRVDGKDIIHRVYDSLAELEAKEHLGWGVIIYVRHVTDKAERIFFATTSAWRTSQVSAGKWEEQRLHAARGCKS